MNILKLFDAGVMIAAFLSAALFVLQQTDNVTPAEFFSMRVKIQNFAIFSALILLWHIIFCSLALYKSRRFSNRKRDAIDVLTAVSLGTVVILLGAIILHIKLVTASFLVVFWLVSSSMAVSSRLAIRTFLGFVRKRGYNQRQVVIVGTNARALEFAARLDSHPELGCRIAGFVDREWAGLQAFRQSGYGLLCDIEAFRPFLRHSIVDEVVIALPFRSMHEWSSLIASACEEQGITVRVLNNIFDLKRARADAEEFEADAFLTHLAGWVDGWPVFVKTSVDFVISLAAVVLLSPLLLFVAIVVKLTSRGPVLFKQKRVGLHKRPIHVYKFRTMEVDAENRIDELKHLNEVSGPVFKIRNDPRITQLGRFLRKTSIDELPQLFNVLRGEMSLVGPRPLPFRDYEGFNEDWQRRRFSVKPGITCLWQVQGRSSIPFKQWMELDLQYIEKWSLWLDFKILLRTIPAVLRGAGAA